MNDSVFSTSECLQTVLEKDLEAFPQGQHYLFFDSALDSNIIRQYFLLEEAPEYLPLYLGQEDDLLLLSPYLVKIKNSTFSFIDWLHNNDKQWCFAFSSNYSLDEQLPFWQSILQIQLTNHELCAFRFYDAKVARQLIAHAKPSELAAVFQPCNSLLLSKDALQWERVLLPESGQTQLHYKSNYPWLELAQDTVNAISRPPVYLKSSVKDMLWNHYPAQLAAMTPSTLDKLLDGIFTRCENLAIQSEQHITLFACLTVEIGEHFYKEQKLAQLFASEQARNPQNFGERALDKLAALTGTH